jgi:single-strand DNA-binding protein
MSVNKAIIVGRLGADPEIRFTQSGAGVTNFNVATDSVWKDKEGQKQSRTEWHRIVVWGPQAEVCQKFRARDVRFLGGRGDQDGGSGNGGGGDFGPPPAGGDSGDSGGDVPF